MPNTSNIDWRYAGREIRLLLCCAMLSGSMYGHKVQAQATGGIYEANKTNVANAIAKVKSGDFAAWTWI